LGHGGATKGPNYIGARTEIVAETGFGSNPIVVIGGTGVGQFFNATIGEFLAYPQTDYDCGDGILFAAGWNNTGNVYETTAARQIIAYSDFPNLGTARTGGHGIRLLGNMFHCAFTRPFAVRPIGTGFITSTANNTSGGITRPGQIFVYTPYFDSLGRVGGSAGGPANADSWAVDAEYTSFFGGNFQGNFIARLGYSTHVFGTHIETDNAAADTGQVCVLLHSQWGNFQPAGIRVDGQDGIALFIGESGGSLLLSYKCYTPLITGSPVNTGQVGIYVSDNARNFSLHVGKFTDIDTDIVTAAPKNTMAWGGASYDITRFSQAGAVKEVIVNEGDTIPIDSYEMQLAYELNPGATDITLNTTNSIADGKRPAQRLTLFIQTAANGSVTLNENTNVRFKPPAALTLRIRDSVSLLWQDFQWIETARAVQ
jgi:hypothetical protein